MVPSIISNQRQCSRNTTTRAIIVLLVLSIQSFVIVSSFHVSNHRTFIYPTKSQQQSTTSTRLFVSAPINQPVTTNVTDAYSFATSVFTSTDKTTPESSILNNNETPVQVDDGITTFLASAETATTTSRIESTATVTEDDSTKKNGFNTILSKIYEKIGSIDEDRYISKEYISGDVPQLFSTLQYETSITEPNKIIGVTNVPGSSVLGAILLIAGTTVGAGVLALPSATIGAGFLPSTVAMLVAYGYMVVSGLLIAELQLNRIGTTGKSGTGLLDLYNTNLAGPVALFGTIVYFLNQYSLMVAYIAQGGNSLLSLLPSDINTLVIDTLPSGIGQLTFASIIGLILYNSYTKVMEQINNVLVSIFLVAFAIIVSSSIGTADFTSLLSLDNQHPEHIVDCFPILFLAFVYQNVIPTIVTQLEGNRKKIILSIVGGTTIPLVMFITWNAIILGNVAAAGIDPSTLDPVSLLTSGALGEISTAVSIFSLTAVTTSIIGFTYGLVESWKDTLKIKSNIDTSTSTSITNTISSDSSNTDTSVLIKPLLYALVFVPPLTFAINDPTIFYNALEYGGTFGVTTLFLILPPIMVWKERYGADNVPLVTKPMVPFGKIPLGSMWKAAGTLIIEQGAEKLGFFEFIQHTFNL